MIKYMIYLLRLDILGGEKTNFRMNDSDLLYEKIAEYLKDKIYSGELKVGDRLPTEMELADQFKVSRITSKRALENLKNEGLVYRVRGSGSYVAEHTVQKEKETLSEVSLYQKVISVVIPFGDSLGGIMDTITGISDVLSKEGYIMDIRCTSGSAEDEQKVLRQLYDQRVGGIIFYPRSDRNNLELINMLYLEDYPFVVIDKYYESVPVCSVVSDNFQGMYDVTKYLLEQGHRRIAFLSDAEIESATSVRNRYFGYAKALKEYGITVDSAYVKNGDLYRLNPDKGEAAVKELMAAGVTAICAINDYVALFLISCMKRLGISVPEQMSVVGFDDVKFNRILEVQLTTVRQDMYQIGKCAGETVLEMIEKGKPAEKRKVVPTKLVVRSSSRGRKK